MLRRDHNGVIYEDEPEEFNNFLSLISGGEISLHSHPNQGQVQSDPPAGKCKVTNFYVDSDTGKLAVEYDNTPV